MLDQNRGYSRTMAACFIGYIVQATICTLAPLLYVRYQAEFHLSLEQVSLLITMTFAVQLLTDLLSSAVLERIGYKRSVLLAHIFAAAGFTGMAFLPDCFESPYVGLLISCIIYSIGAGIIEVLISPIVEACPTKRKSAAMNLLHSFFGWGQAAVVLLSTLFFHCFGIENWRILCCLWAIVPACNAVLFFCSPIPVLQTDSNGGKPVSLLRQKLFWVLFVMMLCAGACELSVSQWASTLIETELHVSKTVGDLAGPCLFAIFMAVGRLIGVRFEDNEIQKVLWISGVLCLISYLLIALAPWPALSLAGCALCGLSVSLLWPGTLSLSAQRLRGGTAMFALLALAGDVGCTAGPTWAGMFAGMFSNQLKVGILFGLVFPLGLLLSCWLVRRFSKTA